MTSENETPTREVWKEWVKGMKDLPRAFRLTRLPIIGKYLYRDRFVGDPTTKAWMVGVYENVDTPENVHLPFEVVKQLILKSAIRYRMKVCVCRETFNCQHFPHEIGTMFVGRAFKDADKLGLVPLTVEEALAHAEKAVSLGLAPTIIWERENQTMFGGVMSEGVALCFCCNCCCDYRLGLRVGHKRFRQKVFRPEGVSLEVSDACILCGKCAEKDLCSVNAITLGPKKAEIDLDVCVGCGACVQVCPEKAISFVLDPNIDVAGKLLAKVEEYTDVS